MVVKKRGRQPKQTSSAAAKTPAEGEVSTEVKVLPADTPDEYYFESKYAEDCFTLIKPSKDKNPDGSMSVNPGAVAQFSQHGCILTDAHQAGILRQIMEERPETGLSESMSMEAHHASMIRKAKARQRRRQLSEAIA